MSSSAYKRYLLGVLVLLLAFNFIDRWALGLVLQIIKVELHLSDTQLGLLTGIAFALFYSVMGLPIARWADRGNRVNIIALTAAVWSVAVASCGLVHTFGQLLLVRACVAIGEAGGFVPGFSLVADYFTRAERPRAVAIYTLGGPLSFIIGYLSAGWLSNLYGWRVMFIILGAPGLLLAAVVRLTIREPRSLVRKTNAGAHEKQPSGSSSISYPASFLHVGVTLLKNATYRHLLLCLSVIFFFVYGILQWQPTFFIRSYGMSSADIAPWFAVSYGVGGIAGTYLGGEWASRHAANNEQLQLRAIAATMVVSMILSIVMYVYHGVYFAIGIMSWVMFSLVAINGPLYATIQTLVPDCMRATAVAIVMLSGNLIGMGLGPLVVGMLSDALRPRAGDESLRYALLILSPGFLWAAWHAWRASRTVTRDLEASAALQLSGDVPIG